MASVPSVKSEARPFAEGEGKVEGSEIERNGASILMSGLLLMTEH